MEELFETFFTDRKTAYVFTADHGMTDWGSHGAGSSSETDTPFITWGAGIRRNTQLHEIEQADIAPFMATLIGVPVPVNSLGVVPIEFLDIPEQDIAYALFANAQQMCTLFDEKQRRVEDNSWRLFFKPFLQLSPHDIQQSYHSISNAMESLLYQDAVSVSTGLISLAPLLTIQHSRI